MRPRPFLTITTITTPSMRKRDTQGHRANSPLSGGIGEARLINFGSPRRPADRCTYADSPAEFALCLSCPYNRGARGSGIVCAHRFGIDPTLVDGVVTQFDGDGIRRLEPYVPPSEEER